MLKKLAVACAAISALLTFSSAPASANVDDMVGQWSNQDSSANGVTRIVVSRTRGGDVRVDVFGRCSPRDCDWGEVGARAYGGAGSRDVYRDANVITAEYNTGGAHRLVIIESRGDGLSYEVFTDFTDRSGRSSYVERGDMRRMVRPGPGGGGGGWPPPGGGGGGWPPGGHGGPGGGPGGGPVLANEDCIGFNTANLRISNSGGNYTIMDGSHAVTNFSSQSDAQHGLDVIRNYGFTSQCWVARPNPSMTYWLAGRNVPRNDLPGQDCIAVNPANVAVQNVSGRWTVVDGRNWLLNYGSNRANADQAVAVIQNYNLNRQCFVTRGASGMQYWLSR